jgi:hypothetical protein
MMHLTDITGSAGVALAIVVLMLRLPVVARLSLKQKLWLAAALLILVAMPLGSLSVIEAVRGVSGDLSIATLLLLALALNGKSEVAYKEKYSLLIFVVVGACALYPFALGLGMFDTYRLGFGELWFIAGLSLLALAAWLRQYMLIASSISFAVLAWSAGWYESNNLWDYLLDPWCFIYALGALIKSALSKLRAKVI